MIQISDKQDCCGCEACVQVCPVHCISFKVDNEGFYYPTVDTSLCINCNRCNNTCPVVNQTVSSFSEKVYAVQNPDEQIRKQSSSGGIFSLLATIIIQNGGVVFGARFDKNWNVVHDFTDTLAGLRAFRGSKYVQSRIGNAYQLAEQYLKEGRKVMFSGTSCQIAGLKKFLRKEYDNLLAVDIICHGVPSPLAWQKFLDDSLSRSDCRKENLRSFSFRDKRFGWKDYQTTYTVFSEACSNKDSFLSYSLKYNENSYMQAFLNDYILRPSCYHCPAKNGKSCSDITLGDFWGINYLAPELDDDKGCSLLVINRKSAEKWIKGYLLLLHQFPLKEVIPYNPSLKNSVKAHVNRSYFFYQLSKRGFFEAWSKTISQDMWNRFCRKVYRYL